MVTPTTPAPIGSKLTVVSNVLQFSGGKGSPAYGDPGAWGAASFARAAGRAVLLRVNRTSGSAMRFGWDADQSGARCPTRPCRAGAARHELQPG